MSILKPWTWFGSGADASKISNGVAAAKASPTTVPATATPVHVTTPEEQKWGTVNNAYVPGASFPTLVVVDMQPFFTASQDEATLAAVADQMRLFVKKNWPIVILEMSGFGDTDKRLLEIVESGTFKYHRYVRMLKHRSDGSTETVDACRDRFNMGWLRVCGVNTTACVHATVYGLLSRVPNTFIEVLKDACNDSYRNDFSYFKNQQSMVVRTTAEAAIAAEASKTPDGTYGTGNRNAA